LEEGSRGWKELGELLRLELRVGLEDRMICLDRLSICLYIVAGVLPVTEFPTDLLLYLIGGEG
jgi:hypothetical protein